MTKETDTQQTETDVTKAKRLKASRAYYQQQKSHLVDKRTQNSREVSHFYDNIVRYRAERHLKPFSAEKPLPLSIDTVFTVMGRISARNLAGNPEKYAMRVNALYELLSGKRQSQLAGRIRFESVQDIADDLRMPVEGIIYGTVKKRAIAQFNYDHYDELGACARSYLSKNLMRHHILGGILKTRILPMYTFQQLSAEKDWERHYTNQNWWIFSQNLGTPRYRTAIEIMAKYAEMDPVEILELPISPVLSHAKRAELLALNEGKEHRDQAVDLPKKK